MPTRSGWFCFWWMLATCYGIPCRDACLVDIPYRNSMMTSILRDSLGGNCKTIMIATINPEASHTEESLSTCKFAQRVALIKNRATVNEDVDPSVVIGKLRNENLNLREEINEMQRIFGLLFLNIYLENPIMIMRSVLHI